LSTEHVLFVLLQNDGKIATTPNGVKRTLAAFWGILTSGWQQCHFDAAEALIKIVGTFARGSQA
jgi:hypothetical protein